MENNVIELKDIALAIEDKTLFSNLCVSIRHREKFLITGNSGIGKTTLLKCMLGLAKPSKGEIWIMGSMLNKATVWELRRYIAYVPQEPELGNSKVKDFLDLAFSFKANKDLYPINNEDVNELLEEFHLPINIKDKDVGDISGGEKQRIAIISALLLNRPIIIMDEPTSALDNMSKKKLIDTIKQSDNTWILVSHDKDITNIVDTVFHLKPM